MRFDEVRAREVRVRRMVRQGMLDHQIADAEGISRQRVLLLRRRLGLPANTRGDGRRKGQGKMLMARKAEQIDPVKAERITRAKMLAWYWGLAS